MQASAKSLRAVAEQDSQYASSFPCARMKMEVEAFDKHSHRNKKQEAFLMSRTRPLVVWLMLERKSKKMARTAAVR
jgi:hypothetical protein